MIYTLTSNVQPLFKEDETHAGFLLLNNALSDIFMAYGKVLSTGYSGRRRYMPTT